MFIMGGVVAGFGGLLLKLPDAVVMIGVGLALILADAIFRLRSRPEPGWVTSKELGGYFFFLPVWILGVLVVILNIINGIQQP